MIDAKMVANLGKAGAAVILAVGLIAIFYLYMSHRLEQDKLNAEKQRKKDEHQEWHDKLLMEYMERQTIAFEKIVEIYSGPDE